MRGIFDEEELRPAQQGKDRELTLSSATLLGIFFGLVLICGVCFGLGYAMGRRALQEPAGNQAADATQASGQTNTAKAKPSAVTANPVQATPSATDAAAIAEANGAPATPEKEAAPVQTPVQPGVSASLGLVSQPVAAVKPAAVLMVQIAAVTDAEDADVLMGALRKRGYAVTGQKDAGDGLIHVRIGPFASRDEADKWRMKLLNDGYNAILQP